MLGEHVEAEDLVRLERVALAAHHAREAGFVLFHAFSYRGGCDPGDIPAIIRDEYI